VLTLGTRLLDVTTAGLRWTIIRALTGTFVLDIRSGRRGQTGARIGVVVAAAHDTRGQIITAVVLLHADARAFAAAHTVLTDRAPLTEAKLLSHSAHHRLLRTGSRPGDRDSTLMSHALVQIGRSVATADPLNQPIFAGRRLECAHTIEPGAAARGQAKLIPDALRRPGDAGILGDLRGRV